MGNRYKLNVDISSKHENVTGSFTKVTVHFPEEKVKFIIDFGMYQGEENNDEKNYAPLDFDPQEIKFVLATHNHTDHVGRIPLLYRKGYSGQVHVTKDTSKMLQLSLEDNEKIIKINAEENNRKPLYTNKEVAETLDNVMFHEFEDTFEPYPGVKVTFFMNGHLIGAAIILIQICHEGYDDTNILFTGDYKKDNIFFKVKELPQCVRELPITIVSESTYGYVDSKDATVPVFEKNVIQELKDKNIILIPVFSLGRAQEILYKLKCMQESNVLDVNIPIYLDGKLAINYCSLYKYQLDIDDSMKNFIPDNFSHMNREMRANAIKSNTKKIIATTSGMGNHGPAQEYIPKLIERRDVCIHFAGYTAPTTLGYNLINSQEKELVEIGSVVKRKLATVKTTGEFSTHAKRDELLEFYNQFDNIRMLLIHHGDMAVKESFSKYCKENLKNCREVAILGKGFTIRLDAWGLVKQIDEKM